MTFSLSIITWNELSSWRNARLIRVRDGLKIHNKYLKIGRKVEAKFFLKKRNFFYFCTLRDFDEAIEYLFSSIPSQKPIVVHDWFLTKILANLDKKLGEFD